MTLGGIAAGIGLILDDAIVVVENFHRHRVAGRAGRCGIAGLGRRNHPRAARLDADAGGGAAAAGIAGRCAGGVLPSAGDHHVGRAAGLAGAGIELHAGAGGRGRAAPGGAARSEGRAIASRGWLARSTARALRWTLRHAWVALRSAVALCVAVAVLAYRHVETGFVPEMDEGAFVLDYWSPPGTSLAGDRCACCRPWTTILRAHAGGDGVLAPHRRGARLLPHRDQSRRLCRAPAPRIAPADRRGHRGRARARSTRACRACGSSSCRSCRT